MTVTDCLLPASLPTQPPCRPRFTQGAPREGRASRQSNRLEAQWSPVEGTSCVCGRRSGKDRRARPGALWGLGARLRQGTAPPYSCSHPGPPLTTSEPHPPPAPELYRASPEAQVGEGPPWSPGGGARHPPAPTSCREFHSARASVRTAAALSSPPPSLAGITRTSGRCRPSATRT